MKSSEPAVIEAPYLNKRGGVRKEFWEDLLIEMARQLWSGELQPERQSQIEQAMFAWLVRIAKRQAKPQCGIAPVNCLNR